MSEFGIFCKGESHVIQKTDGNNKYKFRCLKVIRDKRQHKTLLVFMRGMKIELD